MWKYNGSERPPFAKEPGPGEESVWDYPRPPKLVPFYGRVEVKWLDTIIASTTEAFRILETASPPSFYLPPAHTDLKLFREATGSSFCEWKGKATYWDIEINGVSIENAAWSYNNPNPAYRSVKNYFSFYPSKTECYVEGVRVKPQPGGFYGGWMTPNIIGPVKGEPGTGAW